MTQSQPFSPHAKSLRRFKQLVWGAIFLLFWATVTTVVVVGFGQDMKMGAFLASQMFLWWSLILGAILLALGIIGEVKARRFHTTDLIVAHSLDQRMRELAGTLGTSAHASTQGEVRVTQGRLVEVQRHFDSQTSGAITGVMTHQLRLAGSSFSATYMGGRERQLGLTGGTFSGAIRGLSAVDLAVNTTTRDMLLGDALFAVVEVTKQDGSSDTYRLISMSQPGLADWIGNLVQFTAGQFGGGRTYSGVTVQNWLHALAGQATSDTSYVADRLTALDRRPREERDLISLRGVSAGRNMVVATALSIGDGTELKLMPAQFPALFGQAIGQALGDARSIPVHSDTAIPQAASV